MPELPEVSYSKKYADATVLHKKISELNFLEDLILEASKKDLKAALVGNEFKGTTRHGKYLFLENTGGKSLVLHFGMTGHLEYAHHGEAPEYAYFTIRFTDDSKLFFICPRKLARVYLSESVAQFKKEHDLGPDALDLSLEGFQEITENRRGSIKGLLMNQKAIAGLGNLYSDEVLFQSKVHPKKRVSALSEKEVRTIYKQIGKVLERVTESRVGVPPCHLITLPATEKWVLIARNAMARSRWKKSPVAAVIFALLVKNPPNSPRGGGTVILGFLCILSVNRQVPLRFRFRNQKA